MHTVVRQCQILCLAPVQTGNWLTKRQAGGGAKLDQIQLSLGHASIQTAERYLGVEQDLSDGLVVTCI